METVQLTKDDHHHFDVDYYWLIGKKNHESKFLTIGQFDELTVEEKRKYEIFKLIKV